MPATITLGVAMTAADHAFAAAHARLLRDPAFQFALQGPPPGAPGRPPPSWLISLFRLLGTPIAWLAPYLGLLVWGLLAAGVVAIIGVVAWAAVRRRPASTAPRKSPRAAPEAWRPDPGGARVLLGDADRLAAGGRYAEAARLILHRSVADVEARRPDLIATADTSREIATLEGIPEAARAAFGLIARKVEASLFARRPMDATAFEECRRAYAAFALPATWAAG